ncbi:MAG: hypothetical protein ACTSXZ_05630 [Alphaproteobacteria bacterium]
MHLNRFFILFAILALACGSVAVISCGDDDDDDETDDDVADDDTADDDISDDDVVDDDIADDDTVATTWEGDQTLVITTPDGDVPVDLNGLPAFTWNDPEDQTDKSALLVSDVVAAAFAGKDFDPEDYKFNFIASDGYNILSKKLEGDYRGLPAYGDLDMGWFIEYEEDDSKYIDIRVIWDEDLGYENFMGAKMMDGGTIEMVENILFEDSVNITVDWMAKGGKTVVDLQGLPTFYDEDNEVWAVMLHHIVAEAALEGFDTYSYDYEFNFISNDADGNWSLADNLEPSEPLPLWEDYENDQDIHHGWIEDAGEDGYRLFWHEDTGFSGMYGVKHMDDGYIEVHEVVLPTL